jgi:RNA polymerase sigma factor (sigma-70 family)
MADEPLRERMNMIYRYLLKSGASHADAEDIVQETFYKFYLYMDSIQPEKAASWLFKVALNQYYDLCRKRKGHVHIPLNPQVLVDGSDPEDAVLLREKKAQIEQSLDELTVLQRQLLVLKYEVGLSYKEIAELLDMKAETIKTYLYRARNKFEQIYRRLQHHES